LFLFGGERRQLFLIRAFGIQRTEEKPSVPNHDLPEYI